MEIQKQSVHTRMALIKAELSRCKIPKSGKNKFSGFVYHELTDFMPFINELNAKHGVNTFPKFLKKEGICVLTVVNAFDSTDKYDVVIPFEEAQMLAKGGEPSVVDAIQRMGSTITYNRRYLYMSAYDIVESDGVDALPQGDDKNPPKQTPQPEAKPTPKDFNALYDAAKKDPTLVAKAFSQYSLTKEQSDLLNQIITK
jgi:hypothetical protein